MKTKQKKAIKVIVVLIVLILTFILWLVIETGYQKWSISAICPKCLQRASISEIKIHGLTIYRSLRLNQNPITITSSDTINSDALQIFSSVYEEILGQKCDHIFKKGDFGFRQGDVNTDGIFDESQLYTKRIGAIKALYITYTKTGNKDLAKSTYLLIDDSFPINDDNMYEANEILKMRDNLKITLKQALSMSRYPEASSIAKAMVEYETIIPRLKQIENEDQWRELLLDMESDEQIVKP